MSTLSRDEVEGAYRRLCASMIAHAAFVLADVGNRCLRTRQDEYEHQVLKRQRQAARGWVRGGDAVLTFAEACEAIDMDADRVREGMERFAANPDPNVRKGWRFPAAGPPRSRAISKVAG